MASKKDEKREKAKDRNDFRKRSKAINSIVDFITSNGDKISRSVVYSDNKSKNDFEYVKHNMDDVLDKLLDGINSDNAGSVGGATNTLMNRMSANGTPTEELIKLQKDFNRLMSFSAEDPTMLTGMDNDDIVEHDLRIDTVLYYCSKLDEALNAKADCVLSADHFDRSYLNISATSSTTTEEVFNARCEDLNKIYDLEDKCDEWYREAAKYGEVYLYRVPYKRAVGRLIRNREVSTVITSGSISHTGVTNESMILENFSNEEAQLVKEFGEIEVEINNTGMILDAVEETMHLNEAMVLTESLSLYNEAALDSSDNIAKLSGAGKGDARKWQVTVGNDIDLKGFNKATRGNYSREGISDGLLDPNRPASDKMEEIRVPGTIIRKLPRKNVFPRYINNTCLGFTYIELLDNSKSEHSRIRNFKTTIDPVNSMNGFNQNHPDVKKESPDEKAIKFMAKKLANFIDTSFINTNQDISNDIYNILKYAGDLGTKKKVRVTFIPKEDMEHIFFKQDPITHRGISDIEKSIVPGTLYSAMFITNAIWNLTRGADKRVYYVKQSVDANTATTMMNTIDQIKKGNMGIRQVENIQHILGITGRFNDYIVPTSPSGEEPLRMEVLQGQSVELQTELMQVLLEAAIIPTGIPMEYIEQRRSVEFATQLTMSNNAFLMSTYKRQAKYQKHLTSLYSRLYENQYDESDALKVKLPPPIFLNINNINQSLMNISDMVNKIVEIFAADVTEDIQPYVIRDLNKMFAGSLLDLDEINKVIDKAKQDRAEASITDQIAMGGDGDTGSGGGEMY